MAAGHAVRGVVTAWLSLIVLQTVSTREGSGRVAGLFTDVNRLLQRAFDPDVPAIPDRRGAVPFIAGADSSVTSPDAPYARPPGVPTSPLLIPSPSSGRVGGTGGQPYAT